MNRERGVSSLAMVLLLLLLGGLLLQGLSQQEASFASRVATESQALQHQAVVQSAMEWGRMQSWQRQPAVRLHGEDNVLLITDYEGMSLWRQGEVIDGNIVFSAHGWSDFCPLREAALCLLP